MKIKIIKDTHIKGNLDFDGKIVFKNFCIVDGYIRAQSIKSDGSIESGGYIESSGSIKSGGYIESGEYIESDGSIRSGGFIKSGGYIRSGGSIESGGSIRSGEYIESNGFIESGGYIESSGFIKSGGYIRSGGSIESGGSIRSGEYIFSFTFSIVAKYIITKTLPLGRYFWAEMPPLRKWKKEIQTIGLCWDDYRQMITKAEAEEICRWKGWHWILRAQLEMFFGLKEKYEIKKEEK